MELVLTVCLLAAPAVCFEERLPLMAEQVPPLACILRSEDAVAAWKRDHPKWTVNRWRCVAAGSQERRA